MAFDHDDPLYFTDGDNPSEVTGRPAQIDESAFHEALDQDPTDRDLRNQYAHWLENEQGRDHEARGHRFMALHGLSPEVRTDYSGHLPDTWAWAMGDFQHGPRRKLWDQMSADPGISPQGLSYYWKHFNSRHGAEQALIHALYETEKTGLRLM
jgi:hypothetical protein